MHTTPVSHFRLFLLVLLSFPFQSADGDTTAAFIRALKNAQSSEAERNRLFEEMKSSTPPPGPLRLQKAVNNAWHTAVNELQKSATTPELFREAQDCIPELKRTGEAMRGLIGSEKVPKKKIDETLAPVMQKLGNLYGKLRRNEDFNKAGRRVLEFSAYAQWCGVVRSFPRSLVILTANLAFMKNFVERKHHPVIDYNLHMHGAVDPEESECIIRTNLHRIRLGLRPCELDLRLVMAARKHSEEMAERNYFRHDSPTEKLRTPWMRAARDHVKASSENIATSGNAERAFNQWMYSVGHHRNMISPGNAAVGIGHRRGRWTQMFGPVSILTTFHRMKEFTYVRRRYKAGKDTEALLELSSWCMQHKLLTQAVDELEHILRLDPSHEKARKALEKLGKIKAE